MDIDILNNILYLISIGCIFSIILMALIQKIKTLKFINKEGHIWIINLVLSFSLGIYFSIHFFKVSFNDAVWISIFSFIGAPSLYELLKTQKIIKYKPKSLDDIESKKK
jgi:hypothetical protein